MLSQCIMKIPGVFVNIASGATRRPDVELMKRDGALGFVVCLHMPGNPDNPSTADIDEL